MKKFIYIFLVALMGMGTSCSDYLEVTSPSNVDADFVFFNEGEAYKVIVGGYDLYRDVYSTFFYDISVVGSDAECHPEAYTAQTRHIPEGLYATDGNIDESDYVTVWSKYYKLANRANIIIDEMNHLPGFQAAWATGVPTTWSQLYGEAVVLRAIAYHELTRFYGDVPHFKVPVTSPKMVDSAKCVSRDEVLDYQLSELKRVEPMMYRLGQGGITAERFSRTFVQGLIGRIALYAGGYSLRRTDFDYGDVTFEDNTGDFVRTYRNCMYVRRSDWQDYYQIANQYLKACVQDPGSALLITTDERTPAASFSNPFQRNFQYTMDLAVSPESMYEIGYTQNNGNSEWGYAYSRPSDGGGSNAYPCKAYGQSRVYPSVYYGDFDTLDLRRDVTVSVTANSGACVEKIMTFTPGSRSNGGLAINKWDESRMKNPYTLKQRSSGMNAVTMRMADAILMLAETYAYLDPAKGGSEASAAAEWSKVRARAFKSADKSTKVDAYISARATGDALKEGIAQERKLEFIGEGLRRWDLIRTGKLPQKIVALRTRQTAMYNGIVANHYYTFVETGMTISDTIFTKSVNSKDLGMTAMLTTQCDVAPSSPMFPVKFPSWRGQHDGWTAMDNVTGTRNLAIMGINRFIAPTSAEGLALIAAGYKKTNWGNVIKANKAQYVDDVFKGYPDASFTAKLPPLVIIPLSTETITKSNGLITNGYGFLSPGL